MNNNFVLIKLFLFFTLRGLYLCISFDIINFSDFTIHELLNKKKAKNISEVI